MKAVAVPVLEGHSTIAVYPHSSQDKKVDWICKCDHIKLLYYQDLSFVSVFFNDDKLPKATGQYRFLEFKALFEYCLLPCYSTDQGRLMFYQSKPAFKDVYIRFSFLFPFF